MTERTARKVVHTRSHGVCERCGAAPATNVHHRKNRSQGGRWEASNALHLCGSGTTGCHGYITSHPQESYGHGWSVHAVDDPESEPVLYRGRYVILNPNGGVTDLY